MLVGGRGGVERLVHVVARRAAAPRREIFVCIYIYIYTVNINSLRGGRPKYFFNQLAVAKYYLLAAEAIDVYGV